MIRSQLAHSSLTLDLLIFSWGWRMLLRSRFGLAKILLSRLVPTCTAAICFRRVGGELIPFGISRACGSIRQRIRQGPYILLSVINICKDYPVQTYIWMRPEWIMPVANRSSAKRVIWSAAARALESLPASAGSPSLTDFGRNSNIIQFLEWISKSGLQEEYFVAQNTHWSDICNMHPQNEPLVYSSCALILRMFGRPISHSSSLRVRLCASYFSKWGRRGLNSPIRISPTNLILY